MFSVIMQEFFEHMPNDFFMNLIIKSKSEIRSNFSENTLGKFSNFFSE